MTSLNVFVWPTWLLLWTSLISKLSGTEIRAYNFPPFVDSHVCVLLKCLLVYVVRKGEAAWTIRIIFLRMWLLADKTITNKHYSSNKDFVVDLFQNLIKTSRCNVSVNIAQKLHRQWNMEIHFSMYFDIPVIDIPETPNRISTMIVIFVSVK